MHGRPFLPDIAFGMPTNGTLHGHAIDRQMVLSLAWMVAIFALSQLVLIVALLRTAKAGAPRFSWWNAITFLALAALFGGLTLRAEGLWAASRFQGPSYDALQVEVVGQQFQWYFRYPGPDGTFGRTRPELIDAAAGNPLGIDPTDPASKDDFVSSSLVLPVGREVNLRILSLDVVHGFFIPGMRVKQNAVPGSVFDIHFTPGRMGQYPIVCTQVCGTGHYRMEAWLQAINPEMYQRWTHDHRIDWGWR
jgi:cytochrome c oxidase subunit 2